MTDGKGNSKKLKISSEFEARLSRLEPEEKIRAIVVLETKGTDGTPTRRQSRASRQLAIEANRKAAEPALADIDDILGKFDGKRLAPNVDALGSIPVETTAAGISALSESSHVKTIFEDQSISLIH